MDASFPRGLWPPKLRFLHIGGLKKPISEWAPQNFPTSLDHLELYGGPYEDVTNFNQLSCLLPSSLTDLDIQDFQKVESVSVGLQHLISLQNLSIDNCPKIMDLPETLLPSLLISRFNVKVDEYINTRRSCRECWALTHLIALFEGEGGMTKLMCRFLVTEYG
ncbi:hypothetical protein L1887_32665 [Cichorium endivia]|nr:hypothetical protein L1887_32665 [Cichorium endivia]